MNRNGVETSKIQKLISEFVCLTEEEKSVFLIRCIGECKVLHYELVFFSLWEFFCFEAAKEVISCTLHCRDHSKSTEWKNCDFDPQPPL